MKKHLQFNRNRRLGLADVWVLAALVTATLVLTGRAAWHTWGADSHQSEAIPGAVEHSAGSGVSIFYEPIETIRVGQKVWSDGNPTGDLDERFGDEVDSHTWRKMVLRAPKRDGSVAEVEMLRPGWWLGERDVHAGGRVDIEVPECGIEGLAQVLAVGPCPNIAPGPGRVVTATFHHQSTHTLDLRIRRAQRTNRLHGQSPDLERSETGIRAGRPVDARRSRPHAQRNHARRFSCRPRPAGAGLQHRSPGRSHVPRVGGGVVGTQWWPGDSQLSFSIKREST